VINKACLNVHSVYTCGWLYGTLLTCYWIVCCCFIFHPSYPVKRWLSWKGSLWILLSPWWWNCQSHHLNRSCSR